MLRPLLVLSLFAVAPAAAQATRTPPFTAAQLGSIRWLAGTWRGSGGQYPSFFEEYQFVNDSTIRTLGLKDSTLKVASDSSLITLRKGVITNGSSVIARLSPDTIRFEPAPGGRSRPYTWIRVSANEWRALLEGPNGAPGVTYVMKRIVKK